MEAGKQVYPGQPVGIINSDLTLEVKLYQNMGQGIIKAMSINYSIDENNTESFTLRLKEISITHTVNVITQEMTKREVRKYNERK